MSQAIIKFYGYEDYTVNFLRHHFWKGATNKYGCPLRGYSQHAWSGACNIRIADNNEFIRKAVNGFSVDKLKEIEPLRSRLYIPKDGECLYFDKNCLIPRIKCERKWKRTIRIANADVVVVPAFEQPRVYNRCLVLVNDKNKQVFIQEYSNEIPILPEIGDTFERMLEDNRPFLSRSDLERDETVAMIALAKDAKVLYNGELYYYSHKAEPLFSIADGLYPRVVFEKDLLDLLGDEDNKFTTERVQSLIELINSPDKDTVHQGLRILAEMDYAHYPAITRYILKSTERRWNACKPFNNAVKFMFEKIKKYGFYNPFDQVSYEEFDLAKDIFMQITTMTIEDCLSRIRNSTNMKVLCNYKVDLQLDPPPEHINDLELSTIEPQENEDIEQIDASDVDEIINNTTV